MHTFLLLKALITRIGLVYLPQDIKIPNQVQEKHYPNFSTWRENLIDVWEFLMRNGSVTNSDYFSRNLATLRNWVTLMWPSSSPILGWLTVWKFHSFSITLILREINFGEATSSKTTHICNFRSCEFCWFGDFKP